MLIIKRDKPPGLGGGHELELIFSARSMVRDHRQLKRHVSLDAASGQLLDFGIRSSPNSACVVLPITSCHRPGIALPSSLWVACGIQPTKSIPIHVFEIKWDSSESKPLDSV